MSSDKEVKRGSRAWFNNKLKAIKALGGEDARALAVKKWSETRPYGATDLEHIERVLKLRITSQRIQDRDATAAIEKIIQEGDQQQLAAIEELLSEKVIEAAINAQRMDEDSIRDKAKRWSLLTDKTELSMRRKLRLDAKQGTARINMALGLIGENGYHHATPHELDLRNQQKARWQEFGESVTLTRGDESIGMLDVMRSAGKKKLAETYALTKGLESYAKAAGLTWAFITLTAPVGTR